MSTAPADQYRSTRSRIDAPPAINARNRSQSTPQPTSSLRPAFPRHQLTTRAWTYAAYLAVSAVFAVYVAHTLRKHGRPFLIDCFAGDERLADTANYLLVVGYIAFVLLTPAKNLQPNRTARRFQGEMTLLRTRAVKMGKDTKRPAADQKLDQQKVIKLTEYVQKLGSVERARKALDALEQLRRAA